MRQEMEHPVKDGLEKAKEKFRRNPLIYAMILTGVIGVLCPFIGWLFQFWLPQSSLKSEVIPDLEVLKKDLEGIRESYKKVQNIVENVIAKPPNQWKLNKNQRELLGKFSRENKESPSLFIGFFRLTFFLIQGSFFFLMGVWIEKKWGVVSRVMPRRQLAAAVPEATEFYDPPEPEPEEKTSIADEKEEDFESKDEGRQSKDSKPKLPAED